MKTQITIICDVPENTSVPLLRGTLVHGVECFMGTVKSVDFDPPPQPKPRVVVPMRKSWPVNDGPLSAA